ncbi:hypothetical protein SAMN04488067_1195 [Halorubrum xinjiangense]|uniref:Uncharacterized protein n=1 Tax=Halorubrum xinjiangense TaxID=261291 RepID=A0A1G7S690_9EURY|nr:hypothetical protein [Halorubrum xinjiangense]SDG18545.1 hypothetical protein SAMN04488067_1195 [Halorubrum xinjiangense]
MNTRAEPAAEDEESGDRSDPPDRRFDGPWLAALAATVGAWTLLYALDWAFLTPETPLGASIGFAHGYLLAPLATATILLDALSLAERRVVDLGVFKWVYALAALPAPPVAAVYYAHREWLKPDDAALLGGP